MKLLGTRKELIPALPQLNLNSITGLELITQATSIIAPIAARCGFRVVDISAPEIQVHEIIGGPGGFEFGPIRGGQGTTVRSLSIRGPRVHLGF